jgi:hypothetical protein
VWPLGAWDIGEQEGALTALVQAITDSGTITSDFDRARIAVLAESWDCWTSLRDALAECPRDPRASQALAIIEGTPRALGSARTSLAR